VECQSKLDATEAIGAGADIVMLDNMKGNVLSEAATNLKKNWSGTRKFLSGKITEHNITEYFLRVYVDILSMGSLFQGVPHVDFSLKIKKAI
ncbi:8720_t:CDS:2, partial [Paraglomus brasilianum]